MFFIKMCRALGFVCIPQADYNFFEANSLAMMAENEHLIKCYSEASAAKVKSDEKILELEENYSKEIKDKKELISDYAELHAQRNDLIKQNTINELVADSMVKLVDQQFDIIFSLEKRLEVLQAVAAHQSHGDRG